MQEADEKILMAIETSLVRLKILGSSAEVVEVWRALPTKALNCLRLHRGVDGPSIK